MKIYQTFRPCRQQRGSALLFCIVLLVALTFTAIASVQTGIFQLRMSGALEDEMNAFQTAQSAIDFSISSSSNLPTTGNLNVEAAVALSGDAFIANTGEIVTASAMRVKDCGIPPRTRVGSSLLAFSSFEYKINADVDKRETNRGRSHQRQGVIILGPKC